MSASRIFALGLTSLLGLSVSACSWSRFDDVTGDAPTVLLDKPGSMKDGYGVTMATATQGGQTEVLVGGAVGVSGAAMYQLGDKDSPGTTSVDAAYCTGGSAPCYLSSSLAGFANATGPDEARPLCFAVGVGTVETPGIIERCQDAFEYTLAIPKAANDLLTFSLEQAEPFDFPLATDRTDHPSLLASAPTTHSAWFYPSQSLKFSQLSYPKQLPVDDTFGVSLAVLPVGDGRVYAVGVPGKSEVLLWRTDGGASSSYIGCLGGIKGLGRALAAGPVNGDEASDLVVSDALNVSVIDGQALFDLPATTSTECGFSSLPAGALLGSFGCGSSNNLSGCAGSNFGAALAVGDIDGDGDGEVIVGAPDMTVREQSHAGAILVFDADSPGEALFADAKFLSSADEGDRLGTSIVTPHIDGRDIIAAGAPGNGKAALFYCSTLIKPGHAGVRCP